MRLLVDLELTNDLRYNVLVERKGFAFFVVLEYENLPNFCSSCNTIGHNLNNFKRRVYKTDNIIGKQNVREEIVHYEVDKDLQK